MTEPLTLNTIEKLGRAIFAQLTSLTGSRGTGFVEVTTIDRGILPANAYLIPVVNGELAADRPFKVARNPDVGDGGWTFEDGDSLLIPIVSNVGGARHNLPAGTLFRFDPRLPEFAPTATLQSSIADASSTGALLKQVAFFEDLDSGNPAKDVFDAGLETPGALLVWEDSEPVEGSAPGLRQGGTRGGRAVRFMRESFVLYVVVSRMGGDAIRRQEGLIILQAISRLLSDHKRNIDGETLSTVGGGIEINQRARFRRGENLYIYALRFRTNQTLQPIDDRDFERWLAARYDVTLPARQAPEPESELVLVDDTEVMP